MISRCRQAPRAFRLPFLLLGFCGLVLLIAAESAGAATKEPSAVVPVDPALCQLIPREVTGIAVDKATKKKARAQLLIASRAYEASDYAASIKALREAYATEPTLDTLFNIAQACREAGAAAEVIPLYEFTLKYSEDDAIKADCQRHLGTLRPKVAQELDARAQKLLQEEKFTAAITAWEQAYKLDPQPAYLLGLAGAQHQSGRLGEAISTYERLSAVSSADGVARDARAALVKLRTEQAELRAQRHLGAGEYAQAFAAWQEASQLDPQPRYIFQIAESARLAGLQSDALASYQRFLNAAGQDGLSEERQKAQAYVAAARLREKEDQRIAEGKRKPVYKKWWFWTTLGGVAAAAVIIGGVVGAQAAPKSSRLSDLPSQNVVDL